MLKPVLRYLPLVIFGLGATALLRIGGQADTPLLGSLDSIPRQLMGYSARDQVVSKEEQRVAGMDTYLMRAYLRDSTYFSLYVGYYEAQNQGKSIHSPKNCLPGGGWVFRSTDRVGGVIPGRPEAQVNRVVIEKGFDRQLILYWYQDRGRIVASEYAAKGFLILDATTHNRTDGALVRISTPIVGTEQEAFRHATAFVQEAFVPLSAHLPG